MEGLSRPIERVDERPADGMSSPVIELRNVTKSFVLASGDRIDAVKDFTLDIHPGEFVCVIGPSGHGKSTVLNLMAGFEQPSSGEVLGDGKPVRGPGPDRGVVFQRDTLFLWRRVADNIEFGLRARGVPKEKRKPIVAEYLRTIGLEQFAGGVAEAALGRHARPRRGASRARPGQRARRAADGRAVRRLRPSAPCAAARGPAAAILLEPATAPST